MVAFFLNNTSVKAQFLKNLFIRKVLSISKQRRILWMHIEQFIVIYFNAKKKEKMF